MFGSEISIQYVLSSSVMGPPRLVIKRHFPFTSIVPNIFSVVTHFANHTLQLTLCLSSFAKHASRKGEI
jgi:hypothetical protein